MSNSKLNPEQKKFLKNFKLYNPRVQFFSFPEMRVTIALLETGACAGQFSISIAGGTEQKFRRKVGEYYAASRMDVGQVLPVEVWADIKTVAASIAEAVTFN